MGRCTGGMRNVAGSTDQGGSATSEGHRLRISNVFCLFFTGTGLAAVHLLHGIAAASIGADLSDP